MTKSNDQKTPAEHVPLDAQGTVKALEFGAIGTVASGTLAVIAAANTAPLAVIAAAPVVLTTGAALFGYFSGRNKPRSNDEKSPK